MWYSVGFTYKHPQIKNLSFDGAYTFKYSPREKTKAWEIPDDVPEEEKGRRVDEITRMQHVISHEINMQLIGRVERVLVEGFYDRVRPLSADEEAQGLR